MGMRAKNMDIDDGQGKGQDEQHQVLTFHIANEMYGINILSIREIIDYADLTAVPLMPDFIEGVINLRGNVVPIINLALRFGKEDVEQTKRTSVVILDVYDEEKGEHLDLGVKVDLVNEVIDIKAEDMSAAPTFGSNIRADFIKNIAKIDGKFLIILDVANVLSMEELSIVNEIQLSVGDDMATTWRRAKG